MSKNKKTKEQNIKEEKEIVDFYCPKCECTTFSIGISSLEYPYKMISVTCDACNREYTVKNGKIEQEE
jgi:transcription elongation factor Elf1